MLGWLAVGVTGAFWIACVAVPLAAVLARAGGARAQLLDPDILQVAAATAGQAALSTALSAAAGLPLGLAAARATPRLARWLDGLLLIPAGVPSVVAATAWVAWLGRSGILARHGSGIGQEVAYSLRAVVLAHFFYNAPWIALFVAQARRQVPRAPLEAAETLGAGAWARFRFVTWPCVRPAFGAAAAQTLALCSMSFALVLVLGGGPPVETLETALYSRVRFGELDLAGAAACAAWQLALTSPAWVWALRLRPVAALAPATGSAGAVGRRPWRARSAAAIALLAAIAFVVPYLPNAVAPGVLAPFAEPAFREELLPALRLSIAIAFATATGALFLAAAAVLALSFLARGGDRFRIWAGALLALPGGVSVLVLGLGGWLAYSRWIDPHEGSLGAIVALQCTVFFPLAFRMLWPLSRSGGRARLEAAATLGASPWTAFRLVEWPRWRPSARAAFAMVAAAALGEVAAVSLFYSENLVPLPLLVSRWMGRYRFEEARAASLLLLASAVAAGGAAALLGRDEAVAPRVGKKRGG